MWLFFFFFYSFFLPVLFGINRLFVLCECTQAISWHVLFFFFFFFCWKLSPWGLRALVRARALCFLVDRRDVSEVETVNRIGRPWIVWTVCMYKCEPRRRFRRARGREMVVEWKERISLSTVDEIRARMPRRIFCVRKVTLWVVDRVGGRRYGLNVYEGAISRGDIWQFFNT